MFDDIASVRHERKLYNAKMFASGVSAFREIEELEASVLKDGALSQKHKELIGLALSVGDSCHG